MLAVRLIRPPLAIRPLRELPVDSVPRWARHDQGRMPRSERKESEHQHESENPQKLTLQRVRQVLIAGSLEPKWLQNFSDISPK